VVPTLQGMTHDPFTGIPRVGPSTLFKHMKLIWGPLQDAYDPATQHFNVRKVADLVIAPLLAIVHKKHAGAASSKNITKLLATIKASPHHSEKARAAIPSVGDIACLVRNSQWANLYWWDGVTAKPSVKEYGFITKKNGNVERDIGAVLD
jgi:hypothetical protein